MFPGLSRHTALGKRLAEKEELPFCFPLSPVGLSRIRNLLVPRNPRRAAWALLQSLCRSSRPLAVWEERQGGPLTWPLQPWCCGSREQSGPSPAVARLSGTRGPSALSLFGCAEWGRGACHCDLPLSSPWAWAGGRGAQMLLSTKHPPLESGSVWATKTSLPGGHSHQAVAS